MVFLVVSNDIAYCMQGTIVFVEHHSAEVDLATISLMDLVILTVGTFGWWGAYLSDAKGIYYFKDFPINGSTALFRACTAMTTILYLHGFRPRN